MTAKCGGKTVISRSFELRGIASGAAANGETDFKGESAVYDSEDRLAFLEAYAAAARDFFGDPRWDQPAVAPERVAAAVRSLKPQPVPTVRRRLPLEAWRYAAEPVGPSSYPVGADTTSWLRTLPAELYREGHALVWRGSAACAVSFEPQAWRAFFWVTLTLPDGDMDTEVALDERLVVALRAGRRLRVNGHPCGETSLAAHQTLTLKLELDEESEGGRCNVILDGRLDGDWCALPSGAAVQALRVRGPRGLRVEALRGLGFKPKPFTEDSRSRLEPFSMHPLFRHAFQPPADTTGWQQPDYNDQSWPETTLPHVHGGIMEAGEDLLLRAVFRAPASPRATLVVDSMDPGGEIWLNGRLVHFQRGPRGFTVDLTPGLRSETENVLAVRVQHGVVRRRMAHTCVDRHTGWFLGRAHIDFHEAVFLDNLFVTTRRIGSVAELAWQVEFHNEAWGPEEPEASAPLMASGEIELSIAPWYPAEAPATLRVKVPVSGRFREPVTVSGTLEVPAPRLWSVDAPVLYRAHALLRDDEGREQDDCVATFGIRTVSQEGGVFRLNGVPAMMNGGLLFGMRPPIETQAKHLRCGTLDQLVRDVLTVRELGGNTIRMSIHDGPVGGVNDPRLAEIGDQLGILFQWTTSQWVRTSSAWQIDFDGLAADVRQVRNHPSIVMWQPGNHPKFRDWEDEGSRWYTRVVETILAQDDSRLLSPSANATQLHAPSEDGLRNERGEPIAAVPAWRHPRVVRGNMDTPTGYGAEWTVVRRWPAPRDWDGVQGWIRSGYRQEHLDSPEHAYFDFESEESAAQPNWRLHRGQPWYRIRSYELTYARGSIGRVLTCDEWELGQAWQAFSGSEAYRKKRWLDYDGLAWCTVDGGGNSGTYEKPLTDALGYRKMAFYAIRMAFQSVLAGSADLDIVYGPDDAIRPLILNLGPARTVDLAIEIRRAHTHERAAGRVYRDIALQSGRSRVELPPWRPDALPDGFYRIDYTVTASGASSG